jgi:uracil phosphoribosyltransferase
LGLFREPTTLQPVEYYNNLPHSRQSPTSSHNAAAPDIAILVDPIIATGGTSAAAIQTLKEWGAKRVILVAVLGNVEGVRKASEEWTEGVEVWVGGLDPECDDRGMIKPGLGDIGDRLFLTLGK